jgi:hypothetical protein
MDAYEREEEDICRREAGGEISHKQAQDELRELQRDYRGAAEEAAEDAYHRELENW